MILCLFLVGVLSGGLQAVSAQEAVNLFFGEKRLGEITAAQPTASFRLTTNLRQTLALTVASVDGTLAPRVQVLAPANNRIADIDNAAGAPTLSAVVPLPEPGVYFIDVQAQDGATGQFIITARIGPTVPGAIFVRAGETHIAQVSVDAPEQVYDFNSSTQATLVVVVRGLSATTPDVALWATIPDERAGVGTPLLDGIAFLVARGDAPYSLQIRYSGAAAPESVQVCMALLPDIAKCLADSAEAGPT